MDFIIRTAGNSIFSEEEAFFFESNQFEDNRGIFNVVFENTSLDFDLVQINQSLSHKRGTLRGLHYQKPPYEQAKIVWVSKGSILDVILDLRPTSKTFGKHFKITLQAQKHCLYIPKGFAHGFITLEDDTFVNYIVNKIYNPKSEISINAFDQSLKIDWHLWHQSEAIMSDRDKEGLSWEKCKENFFNYEE